MLECCLAEMEECGIKSINLITANEGMLPGFYEKHGFEREDGVILMGRKRSEEERNDMDLLTSKIKLMYFKYLAAAFGSALISSIYGAVDMAMVGQYQGPEGTAALAVVAPVWNIIYSLGLLMGIGGSVLFTTLRGESEQNQKKSNEYFTAAVIGSAVLAALTWLTVVFFDAELLRLFGAEETLLPLARSYLLPVKFVVPSFLFTQLMSAFLRNDGNPALATKAVLFGGIFFFHLFYRCGNGDSYNAV